MLDEIIPVLKNFRDKIYHLFPYRQDAAMDFVDSLSSKLWLIAAGERRKLVSL